MEQRHNDSGSSVEVVTPRTAWGRLSDAAASPAPLLLDVREVWEYKDGHAQGAVNIPLSELRERYTEVPRDREILCICHLGERSLYAGKFLRRQGWAQVANIEGGTDAWEAEGLPMGDDHAK